MPAWTRIGRRLQRLAPFGVVFCFALFAALLALRVPYETPFTGFSPVAIGLGLAPLATLWPAPRPTRARWLPFGLALVALAAAPPLLELVAIEERGTATHCLRIAWEIARHGMEVLLPSVWLAAPAVAWVVIDTRARPHLREVDRARRIAVAAAVLVVAGIAVAGPRGPAWLHFAPSPWCGRYCCFGGVTARLLATMLASLVVLSAIVGRARPRAPYVAMLAWLASRVVSDAASACAASDAYGLMYGGAEHGFDRLDRLALFATVTEGAFVTIALATFGYVIVRSIALRRRDVALAGAASAVWPLAIVLVLSSSALFDPPFFARLRRPSQRAIWEHVGIEPMRWSGMASDPFVPTQTPDHPSFVLERGGALTAFGGGAPRRLGPNEVAWTSFGRPIAVAVVFDRRATLADLDAALPHVRLASAVELAFLTNDDDPSSLARDRWAFVNAAHQTVTAREITFARQPLLRCGEVIEEAGLRTRRCPHPEPGARERGDTVLELIGPADVPLERILREHDDELVIVVGRRLAQGDWVVDSSTTPWRPPDATSWRLNVPPLAIVLALAIVVAIVVIGLARDLNRARALRARSPELQRAHVPARRVPEWIPIRAIEWIVLGPGAHGYRERAPDRVAVAPLRALPRAIVILAARALRLALIGALRWLLAAGLAVALALALAKLLD